MITWEASERQRHAGQHWSRVRPARVGNAVIHSSTRHRVVIVWRNPKEKQTTSHIPLPSTPRALSNPPYIVEEQVCVLLKQYNEHMVVLGGQGDREIHT